MTLAAMSHKTAVTVAHTIGCQIRTCIIFASRALIFQLLADFHKDVAVVASRGDHEGTAGDAPKRRLGSGIGLFSAPTLQPRCGKQGRRPSQWGL